MAEIALDGVSVSFSVYDANTRSLKKHLVSTATGGLIQTASGASRVQAITDLTLHLKHGDRVGLIGHNGAGKTTLLRVLAGIYEPVTGSVQVEGSIAPLFDISLGMDLESTGRENIVLRGLYLGLSRRDIRSLLPGIVDFSELGSFIDLPLRTYSFGMRMRLAFAVTTAIRPDIVLMDEGIGVGDASFLERANRRLNDFAARAGIVVLASHSEHLLAQLCRTALLLEHGRIIASGDTATVLAIYRSRYQPAA